MSHDLSSSVLSKWEEIKSLLQSVEIHSGINLQQFNVNTFIDKYLEPNFIQSIEMMRKLSTDDWNHIGFPVGVRIAMQEIWAKEEAAK